MPDKKDFIAIFKAEIDERLTRMDQGLVALEKKPDDPELVKELNREAHTIKGASRVMGYNDIQEIAHRIEDIFDKILQRKLFFSPEIASCVFKALDAIRSILGKVIKEEPVDTDVAAVCRDLESVGAASPPPQPAVPKEDEGEKAKEVVAAPREEKREAVFDDYIRVPVSRVNKLLNLTGEMVINKVKSPQKIAQARRFYHLTKDTQKRLAEFAEKLKSRLTLADAEMMNLLSLCQAEMVRLTEDAMMLSDDISSEAFRLDPTIEEIQNKVKELRMLPCSTVFEGFPRMVRDIALQEEKEVDFEVSGGETELDRKVLERIKAPLMHILRNCVDHGIESPGKRREALKPVCGMIRIRAFHEAGNVKIEIEDDGQGLDIEEVRQTALRKHLVTEEELTAMSEQEVLNIIFMNGYSTSPIITDVSGRGIGLDVARRDIEALKGQVLVASEKGKRTKFTLILPLTIAIIQVLLVKTRHMLFAFPMASVEKTVNIRSHEISTIEGKMAIQVLDKVVPLVRLDEILHLPTEASAEEAAQEKEFYVVIAMTLDKWVGFIVDEIVGEEEIFLKGLGFHLGRIPNVAGATILGRGDIIVILDVADLTAASRLAHPATFRRHGVGPAEKKTHKILVVDDTMTTRELEKSILESHGYETDVAVDGLDALDKLTKDKYDLVVTDLQMPRMDGFELCKTIKESKEYGGTPVVIVTALEKDEDKRRGIDVGAEAYIIKSTFNQVNLLETISRLLGT